VEQLRELAQDGADSARVVQLLDEMVARGTYVREQRCSFRKLVKALERQRNALIVSMLAFVLMHSVPGGPFDETNQPLPPAAKANILHNAGRKEEALAAADQAIAKGKADSVDTTAFEKRVAGWRSGT